MLVIQHRANSPYIIAQSDIAEIDVQIDNLGRVVVGHEPDGINIAAEMFLESTAFDKFFLDIKQNLSSEQYEKIKRAFKGRYIGLFDVPMPAGYYLSKNTNFYSRLSEYEEATGLTTNFWLDPLTSWAVETYDWLLNQTFDGNGVIVACPSLHEQTVLQCKPIWNWIKENDSKIKGIVTKHPSIFKEVACGD
jgi:hypothetical protein